MKTKSSLSSPPVKQKSNQSPKVCHQRDRGGHPSTHLRKKKALKRLIHQKRLNDIYINHHSDFSSQLAQCRKLIDQGLSTLYIHGLGVAINRAINLALQLKETSDNKLSVSATTTTVEVTDDMEPLTEDGDYYTHTRKVSALNITISGMPAT